MAFIQEHCVGASPTKAEHISLFNCIQKVFYNRFILQKLKTSTEPTVVNEDNQHCIASATEHRKLNKHFELHFLIWRESAMKNRGEVGRWLSHRDDH